MENESAFPQQFRAWDQEDQQYYQSSTQGLTKLELVSAIILNGYISNGIHGVEAIGFSIKKAKELLKQTEQ